ncbi:hypothetical protein Ddc_10492 [Ditylenchus destructor]|nr:hypothetical protein Ddc_10492 [Ditylenchus destructor]
MERYRTPCRPKPVKRSRESTEPEGLWGRETHIAAAARLFDVEIAVFNDQLNTWRLYTPAMNTPNEASQDKSKFCVPILLHGEVHFELITSLKHNVA